MENIAVIGIDPLNDFGHPLGNLYCKEGYQVVGAGMVLVEHGYKNGWLVAFAADDHPKDSEHFKKWPPHCIHGTWGARFLAGIKVPYGSPIFYKGTKRNEDGYDAFDGIDGQGRTPEEFFNYPKKATLVVWGIATNYCVRAFVLSAHKKNYEVYVAIDACKAVPFPANPPLDFITEERAIADMRAAGASLTTVEEIIKHGIR